MTVLHAFAALCMFFGACVLLLACLGTSWGILTSRKERRQLRVIESRRAIPLQHDPERDRWFAAQARVRRRAL